MKFLLKLALLVAVSGAMVGTYAATATQTFGVKLVVQESCSIGTTPTDVDFGTHTRQTTAVNTDASGSLNINCSQGTPYTIALNGGLNATGSTRQMLSGANVAAYVLYQDSARATPWGNGTTFGTTVSGTGTGAAVATPVYGRLTSLNFPAGTYSDTVTATVTY